MICDKTHLNRRWSLEACIPIMCLSLGRSGSTETSVGLCSCEAGRHFPPASLWPGTFSHHTHPGTTSALSSSAYHSELALLCWPQFPFRHNASIFIHVPGKEVRLRVALKLLVCALPLVLGSWVFLFPQVRNQRMLSSLWLARATWFLPLPL